MEKIAKNKIGENSIEFTIPNIMLLLKVSLCL